MMEQVMGKMPERFARQGARSKPEYFKEGGRLAWPQAKATRQSKKEVRACRSLQVKHASVCSCHHTLMVFACVGDYPAHGQHQQAVP